MGIGTCLLYTCLSPVILCVCRFQLIGVPLLDSKETPHTEEETRDVGLVRLVRPVWQVNIGNDIVVDGYTPYEDAKACKMCQRINIDEELYKTVRKLLAFFPFSFFSLGLDSCILELPIVRAVACFYQPTLKLTEFVTQTKEQEAREAAKKAKALEKTLKKLPTAPPKARQAAPKLKTNAQASEAARVEVQEELVVQTKTRTRVVKPPPHFEYK
jgi:hypothetical protein